MSGRCAGCDNAVADGARFCYECRPTRFERYEDELEAALLSERAEAQAFLSAARVA